VRPSEEEGPLPFLVVIFFFMGFRCTRICIMWQLRLVLTAISAD